MTGRVLQCDVMGVSPSARQSRALGRVGRWHRAIYELRTEGGSRGRDAAAIGLGLFIGCSPLWGLHLVLCWLVGWLGRLNRLKLYLAANVVNPLVAPFFLLAEIQVGAWLRQGTPHQLSFAALRSTDPWLFGEDLLIGSVVVGGVLGLAGAAITYLSMGRSFADPAFVFVVREAADRYLRTGITAWEFARGKLRGDPVYREVLVGGLLPSGGTLIDVGCGQGLMLALLADARQEVDEGRWPVSLPLPPRFDRLIGVEARPRIASIARRALEADADILEGDACETAPPPCRVVLLFDVLHLMADDRQECLLSQVSRALEPDGVVLVREADRASGWRFQLVRIGNWLKALVYGRWSQRFHFRTAADWAACLARHGFIVEERPMGQGTPFANVLLRATRPRP